MKRLFVCIVCSFLMFGNLYSQIPKEFWGTFKVEFHDNLEELAKQIHDGLMDIPNNPNGIVLYDNDLSISNMKNTVSQGNVIYPRGVVLVDEEGTEASIADLAMSLRKNGYQVIDKENNETYDPDDMTLIIDSNSIYKKNNNTGTVSLVYKLKDNDTFTLMPVEDSAFFDAPNYYKMDLEKGERLHLTKYTKANDSSYIELGYVNGSAYISVMCGLWNPYILHPIKEEKPL